MLLELHLNFLHSFSNIQFDFKILFQTPFPAILQCVLFSSENYIGIHFRKYIFPYQGIDLP